MSRLGEQTWRSVLDADSGKPEDMPPPSLAIVRTFADAIRGKNVLFCDVAPAKPYEWECVSKLARTVIVLDHHASSEAALADKPGCFFDKTRAGCQLAWTYFCEDKELPRVLQLIADRDLFKDIPECHDLSAYLLPISYKSEEDLIGVIHRCVEDSRFLNEALEAGHQNRVLVQQRVRDLSTQVVPGIPTPALSGGQSPPIRFGVVFAGWDDPVSDIGAEISTRFSVAAVVQGYSGDDTKPFKISFRSKKGSGIDTTPHAKAAGGGGHPEASGCNPAGPLESLIEFPDHVIRWNEGGSPVFVLVGETSGTAYN